jgi:hypothetical protein
MIFFSFKDFCAGNGFDKCLEAGTAFKGLTNIIGRIETFFLAGTKAEAGAKAGAGTRGTETGIVVIVAAETFGIIGIVRTEAGTIRITETIEAGAGVGVALGIEAFSCARLNKSSR